MFACNGLRTLCLAYKEIPQDEFDMWWEKYKEAAWVVDLFQEKLVFATFWTAITFAGMLKQMLSMNSRKSAIWLH